MKKIYFINAILILLTFKVEADEHISWPAIKSIEKKVALTADSTKVTVELFADTSTHQKLYELRCNKGGVADQDHIDFNGTFQCQLFPADHIGLDLLCSGEAWAFNKCWNTRGVFNYEQLIGPCKTNSQFGEQRTFNMRGIKLELTITNFKSPAIVDILSEKKPPFYSFDFMIKATAEKKATSDFTAPTANEYCGGYYEINAYGKPEYKKL